jgi:hypothetical protein
MTYTPLLVVRFLEETEYYIFTLDKILTSTSFSWRLKTDALWQREMENFKDSFHGYWSKYYHLISELHDGAHRHLCPYDIGTSHSTLIIFAARIMYMLRFYHSENFQLFNQPVNQKIFGTLASCFSLTDITIYIWVQCRTVRKGQWKCLTQQMAVLKCYNTIFYQVLLSHTWDTGRTAINKRLKHWVFLKMQVLEFLIYVFTIFIYYT